MALACARCWRALRQWPLHALAAWLAGMASTPLLHAQLRPAAQPATRLENHARSSTLQEAPARQSHLRTVPRGSALVQGGTASALRPALAASSQLEQVRQLKQALKARETAQQEIVIDLPSDVLFDFDKSTLRPDAIPVLGKAAQLIGAYPQAPVCINGHTDSKGSNDYNQALSLRRARAVAAQLQHAQPDRQWQVRGFGEERPVAPNALPDGSDNPEGRQRNRRVEIVIGALASEAGAITQAGASCVASHAPRR